MVSVPGRKLMSLWKSARRDILASCQPFNSTDDLFEESSRERRENLLTAVIAHDQFNISTRSQGWTYLVRVSHVPSAQANLS